MQKANQTFLMLERVSKMEPLKVEKRRDQIINLLKKYGTLRVAQLVNQVGVSDETIRNDLRRLSEQGLVLRHYGMASLSSQAAKEKAKIEPVANRVSVKAEAKDQLAKAAVSLMKKKEGLTIALDQGSTIARIAELLSQYYDNNLFTSSLLALDNLKKSHSNVYCLGGKFNPEDLSFQSISADPEYRLVHYDYCFIGSSGVLNRNGICSTSFADSQMKLNMIKQSDISVAVIDAAKFTQTSLLKVTDWSDLNYVVTNLDSASAEYQKIAAQTKVVSVGQGVDENEIE